MHEGQLDNGMWDTIWDINSGKQVNGQCHLFRIYSLDGTDFFVDHVGVAAWADSAV